MKCPGCLTDQYVHENGYCAGCGSYVEPDLPDLPALLGIKSIDGVDRIIPLTRAMIKRGRVIYQREVVAK